MREYKFGQASQTWKRSSKTLSRIRYTIILGAIVTSLVFSAIFWFGRKAKVPSHVQFDPSFNIRVLNMSDVYKIKFSPLDSALMWFGTKEGLFVYNRNTRAWIRYGLETGLPGENVYDFCFIKDKAYVATNEGLALLEKGSKKIVPVSSTLGKTIFCVEPDNQNGLFYTAESLGLFHMKESRIELMKIPDVKVVQNPINSIKYSGKNLYVAAGGAGFYRWSEIHKQWKKYAFNKRTAENTLFWDILLHREKIFVLASDNGMWSKDTSGDTLRQEEDFPCKGGYAFAEEQDGFWCGTPWGLWRYYDQRKAWIQFVHPEEKEAGDLQIYSLLNEKDIIWFGTKENGIGYFNKVKVNWQPLITGPTKPNMAAIASLDSILFVSFGYQGGSIDKFSLPSTQFKRNLNIEDGIEDPTIQCLTPCGKRLYFGSFNGFGFYDVEKDTATFYSSDVLPTVDINQILCPDSFPYYLAGLHGAVEYDPKKESFSLLSQTKGQRVTCFLLQKNFLWYGTLGKGIQVMDLNTKKIVKSFLPSSRKIIYLNSVKDSDNQDVVLAVSFDEGCFLIDKNDKVEKISDPQKTDYKKSAFNIMAARMIDDYLWLGLRDEGCIIVDLKNNRESRFTFYQGLVSSHVHSLWDNPQYIWIGCFGGYNRLEKKHYYDGDRLFNSFP